MNMASADNTTCKKRKRAPYLSYLTNPLVEEVPRQTCSYWAQKLECVHDEHYQEMSGRTSASSSSKATKPASEFSTDQFPTFEYTARFEPEAAVDADEWTLLGERDYEQVFANDYEMDTDTWEEEYQGGEEAFEIADESAVDEASDEETQQSGDQKGRETESENLLYAGAKITFGMSLLLIITFAMRHQLSGTALADLLTLIDLHLIAPNCESMATIHKFFKQLKNPVQFHYYCNFCYECIGCAAPTNIAYVTSAVKAPCHISLLSLWNLNCRLFFQVIIEK